MILLRQINLPVPDFGYKEFYAPEFRNVPLNQIVAATDDSRQHTIRKTQKPDYYYLTFNKMPPGTKHLVFFWKLDPGEVFGQNQKTQENKVIEIKPEPVPESKPKRSVIPFFAKLQKKQADRKSLNQAQIAEIREKNLSHPGLEGKKILTFDATYCWARWLGMLQKAKQLHYELKKPLHEHFDRIAGQGDGAIIAAALAAGIDLDKVAQWGINDWRKVHNPGFGSKLLRWSASKIKPAESGYNAKQARKALRKLFVKTSSDLRMKDVLTELQITVVQGDMNVSTHYSFQNPEMELWTAVEDSAVTKMHYNQKETVKGEAIFLGAIEKNDALGLALSENNKNLSITSIGAPVRVNPPAAKGLSKLGHASDKTTSQAAGHFFYLKRVEQLIKKLSEAGFNIQYSRLECLPIDHVVKDDTSEAAMQAGIESGSGRIFMKGQSVGMTTHLGQ